MVIATLKVKVMLTNGECHYFTKENWSTCNKGEYGLTFRNGEEEMFFPYQSVLYMRVEVENETKE